MRGLWHLWAVSELRLRLAYRLGWRPDPGRLVDAAGAAWRAALHTAKRVP